MERRRVTPEPHAGEVAMLSAAADGDASAVRAMLDATAATVYGFVFARVGGNAQAAEDLLQETFLEAMRSAQTFRGEAALTTWLCAIARRRLGRYYESERKEELAVSGLSVVPDKPAPIEDRDEVIRALAELPALHRQVLVMKYMDDRSVEEIAQELGRNRVQIQSLLQRARSGLRRVLESDDA